MRFQPKTETEIQQENPFTPWPAGVYDFEVFNAVERQSAKCNDMMVLTLKVYNTAGESRTVFDYLLEAMLYKLKHAAEACGAGDKFERGELTADDFHGKTGKVKLRVDPAQNGYAAKNAVQDYVVESRADPRQQQMRVSGGASKGDLDDEIPF